VNRCACGTEEIHADMMIAIPAKDLGVVNAGPMLGIAADAIARAFDFGFRKPAPEKSKNHVLFGKANDGMEDHHFRVN